MITTLPDEKHRHQKRQNPAFHRETALGIVLVLTKSVKFLKYGLLNSSDRTAFRGLDFDFHSK
jgi:hypothetical protein